eukprot:351324-Pyramimonas_sp.AAC.1
MLMRQVMQPLVTLLAQQLKVGSADWEISERSKVAKAILQGQPPEGKRSYRILEAASGKLESNFVQSVTGISTTRSLWEHFPATCKYLGFNSLAFRVLSRSLCTVHQFISASHA